MIALGHFPHTASHVKAFQSSAEKKIAESFKNDLDGLKRRCAEMGGGETEGKMKAEYICRLDLLPHVPAYLHFWAADEEFDADCKLLFDGNAENHIDIEYLAHLVESFVAELVGEQHEERAVDFLFRRWPYLEMYIQMPIMTQIIATFMVILYTFLMKQLRTEIDRDTMNEHE